ncbi:biosynthetic-type acetolactate synthase large subunit [bacterium]|nr:biosynthetic-type acetolactate synthase large subunit [bacterium]
MLVENEIKTMKGSKILFETLKNLGVDTIFGYPGGIVLDVYNELFEQSDIKHILVRHEQSAVHAAEGYARETGKCGIVLVTSGPGATNTVSGIVNAYLDGYPLIVLTGQVFKSLLGKNAFQEADICDITRSCTKKVFQITSASEIQSTLKEAMNIATSGKKGPVVVDIVKDVFADTSNFASFKMDEKPVEKYSKPTISIEKIVNRIKNSRKPVIVAGGGVSHAKAENELLSFATKFKIPVVSTMMGLGSFPQDNNNYFGMIGIFGDKAANEIIKKSDLIISLGARFNDRITCMFKDVDLSEKFIQIDINEKEISQFIPTSDFFIGDIKDFLSSISKFEYNNYKSWSEEAQNFKSLNIKRERQTNLLHSFEVIRKIEEYTKNKDVTFTSEVGQHQLWAVQNLNFNKNRRIFVSGGSGTMGFGFPAAIGAAVANPNKTIVCITGDGSFQMGLHELATCMDNNLNIKIMILNNGYLGMVRQLQEKLCDGNYSQTKISNPDFLTLAKSYGANAFRVTTLDEIDSTLDAAFSTEGTCIVDFAVEPMEVL